MRQLTFALAIAVVALAPTRVRANTYEIFIDITSEDDLYDLYASGQISETTFNTLVSLYQRGVNLNSADRQELYTLPNLTYAEVDAIIAYREDGGGVTNPVALVAAGVLSEEKLLAIAPFLVIRDPTDSRWSADGVVSVPVRYTFQEPAGAPPAAVHGDITTLRNLTIGGAAVLTRTHVGEVRYDLVHDALSATAATTRAQLAKLYVAWDDGDWGAIAGSYRVGFGQRLTFDNTDQYTPNGFYGDDELRRPDQLTQACRLSTGDLAESPCADDHQYMSPDFGWSERLFGVAGGIEKLELADDTTLQLYTFASHQSRRLYQYELYNREMCTDPRDDGNELCDAPDVFVRDPDDPALLGAEISFATLPDIYTESLIGGNATVSFGPRAHVGVTAYGATVDWAIDDMDLDFQEWSRRPWGGPYGAIGIDAAWGHRWSDVFVEGTRSFDSMADYDIDGDGQNEREGGGDFAAIIRQVATFDEHEIETSLRYYGPDFKNPYSGAIAAPDEDDGVRGRNETGFRVRYNGRFDKRINLRASADVWKTPDDDPATRVYVRTDIDVNKRFGWGIWAEYEDKDLTEGGRGQCFDQPYENDRFLEPVPCRGQQFEAIGRLRIAPAKMWKATVQLEGELLDDPDYLNGYRKDVSAWLILAAYPHKRWRIRTRTRYLFEDIDDNNHLEQSVWAYADVVYKLTERTQLEARYDFYYLLDDRENTQLRQPHPAQWLWLELESRF